MTRRKASARLLLSRLAAVAATAGYFIAGSRGSGAAEWFQAGQVLCVYLMAQYQGWLSGHSVGKDEGYAEGWRDACADQDESWSAG